MSIVDKSNRLGAILVAELGLKMRYFGPKTAAYYERMRNALFSTTVDDSRPVLKKGSGVWVEDIDGNKFLDFTSQVGIINTGHAPEEIAEALREQTNWLTGAISNDFQFACRHKKGILQHEEVSPVKLAEELIRLSPVPYPKKVLFEISGATAINAAVKICLAANPKRGWFGAFAKAFHGRHGPSLDLSSSKPIHKLLHREGLKVIRLPFPAENITLKNYKENFLFALEDCFEEHLNAIFIEIVQGEGGINIPSLKMLDFIHRKTKSIGALFVVDEVQTGMGRTGKLFASEYLNDPPDILVLSKALGGGEPIGAVIARTDILPNGDLPKSAHSGTMPASPLPVAAALANLRLMEEKLLVKNSKAMGRYLLVRLHLVVGDNPMVIDVDSLGGLMVRVEMASKEAADRMICACASEDPGLLLIGAGEKTIRFMPPLIVSKEEIDLALSIFEKALKTPA